MPNFKTFGYGFADIFFGFGFGSTLTYATGDRRTLGDIHPVFILPNGDIELHIVVNYSMKGRIPEVAQAFYCNM